MASIQKFSKHGVAAAFWIALVTLSLVTAISYMAHNRAYENWRWVEHTHQISLEIEELTSLYLSMRVAWRNFLSARKKIDSEAYETARRLLLLKIESLQALAAHNPRLQGKIKALSGLVDEDIAIIDPSMALKKRGRFVDPSVPFAPDLNWQKIRHIAEAVQNEKKVLLAERSEKFKKSTDRLVLIINTASIFSFGMLMLAFYFLQREVRQRKTAQDALTESEHHFRVLVESERAANKELESFSYSVSHDLRSPLRAINGFARILQEDYGESLDEEGRRLLKVIRDNSNRMGSLIDDLLAFSRLGRKPMAAMKVDMTALAQAANDELQNERLGRSVQVAIHALPPVYGDASLIRQVWVNLLSNSLKFSAHGPSTQIEVGGKEGNGVNVYYVKDNGAGFDMRYYDQLFGIFHRLHRDDEFPGTGVGLAIVQRIILRHNGRVWAEGKPNEGATFFFELPQGPTNE